MKKGIFAGWQDVFSFTFARQVEKKYCTVTVILALIFFLGAAAINVITALAQKDDDEVVGIEKVYMINDSGLETIYTDGFFESYGSTYPKMTFENTDCDVEELAASMAGQESNDLILHLEKTEEGYLMTVVLPEGGMISRGKAENFAGNFVLAMQQSMLVSSDIPMEKLVYAMSGVNTSLHVAGEEDKGVGEKLVQNLLPMLICFVMFFFSFTYGNSVGNVVSIEKTSKLMEMILTHVKPYPLIIGKVTAVTLAAVLQLVTWIVSFIAGFFAGDLAAQRIYDGYHNVVIEVIKVLQAMDGSAAFSIGSAIVGLVCLVIGFLFFCMTAATIACFATKAEELSQVMAFFMMACLGSFYAAYMLPLMTQNPAIGRILRIIPFTSAYLTPGDILVGNVSLLEGCLETGLLLAFCIVLALVAGKTYKSMVLNKGKNVFAALLKKKA